MSYVGYIGASLLLGSYFFNSKIPRMVFEILNVIGSLLLCLYAFYSGVWPFAVINGAWLIAGLVGLWRAIDEETPLFKCSVCVGTFFASSRGCGRHYDKCINCSYKASKADDPWDPSIASSMILSFEYSDSVVELCEPTDEFDE